MSTISVVIPVLNDARHLERCLAALSRQRRPPEEIVVVDNGCTDDSVAVARRFGARIVTETRPGITAASSEGFDSALGEIIARCDADSVPPIDWIERIERTFLDNPVAVAVTGPARFYGLSGAKEFAARTLYLSGYFVSMRVLLGNNVLFGSNCAVRASSWRELSAGVPRDDSEIHDDMDLSYRLPSTSTIIHDHDLVVQISPRPFGSVAIFSRRLRRAVHTFRLHWPEQLPAKRWSVRAKSIYAGRRVRRSNSHINHWKESPMNQTPAGSLHSPTISRIRPPLASARRSIPGAIANVFFTTVLVVAAVAFTIVWLPLSLLRRVIAGAVRKAVPNWRSSARRVH
jgi:glycosyltransferase involved in cell wall biosynthesis